MSTKKSKRALNLDQLILKHGGHKSPSAGLCLLEAVAYVAGEPHSDHPECVCPVIAAFGRSWNDSITSDDDRTRLLKPLIPLMIGTKSTPAIELKRSYLALDWLMRVQVPAWMSLTEKLKVHAEALSQLPEVVDARSMDLFKQPMAAARAAAGAAAWDAARAAAWAAAGAAAGAALKPTVATLQTSALELVHRMIAAKA